MTSDKLKYTIDKVVGPKITMSTLLELTLDALNDSDGKRFSLKLELIEV